MKCFHVSIFLHLASFIDKSYKIFSNLFSLRVKIPPNDFFNRAQTLKMFPILVLGKSTSKVFRFHESFHMQIDWQSHGESSPLIQDFHLYKRHSRRSDCISSSSKVLRLTSVCRLIIIIHYGNCKN